jgi:hypothetical protein
MHIQSNKTSITTAIELLEFLEGGNLAPINPRLLISDDGTLTIESALHPVNDDQAVVLADIDSGSFGDGWGEDTSGEDFLEYLREWDQPFKAYSISVIDSNGREWEGLISQHGLLPCAGAAFDLAVEAAKMQELRLGQSVTVSLFENTTDGCGYCVKNLTITRTEEGIETHVED